MRVFLAGATGAVGRELLPLLVGAGHDVVALCRTERSAGMVRAAGARPVLGDALDRRALFDAVRDSRPQVVMHQLTALAGAPGNLRRFDEEFALTNRLRTEALDAMLQAAEEAGASRFVAQGFCGWPQARGGSWVKDEEVPLDPHPDPRFRRSHAAIRHLERVVPAARRLVGIVVRYGVLYGPGTNFAPDGSITQLVRARKLPLVGTAAGVWSFTHVRDAATAAVASLEHGQGGIYNVVDDDPAPVNAWLPYLAEVLGAPPPRRVPAWIGRLALGKGGVDWLLEGRGSSNAKAKRELQWEPRFASWRDGFRQGLAAAGAGST